MKFNSIGASNAGNYAGAGKAVADSAARVFDVQRKTGPDYAKISQTAMVTQAEEKITAMKTAAQVTEQGIKNLRDKTILQHGIAVKNDKIQRAKNKRKAGVIAGLGRIGGAAFLASRDNTKGREYPTADFKGFFEKWKEQRDGIKSRQDSERAALGEFTPEPVEFDTPSFGGNSGKVTTGDSSNTVSQPGTAQTGQTGWSRLAKVIKTGEGTVGDAGYTTMFTGARFSDTSRHPRQINRSGRLASDAAGAYQFLSTTWDGAKNALGLTDFSPESQEKAGRYLAQKRGINPDAVYTTKAELGRALDKIAPEWASMPTLRTGTSYYGQGGISLDEAWRIYNSN